MKFGPIFSLARPANSMMVGFAVVVGAAVASPSAVLSTSVLLGFLTGFFISSFSMTTNDYYDVEVDRINTPDRPIPSGLVSLGQAKVFALLFLAAGLLFALMTTPLHFGIASAFAGVAWIYNYWGKRHGVIGNLLVALSISIPYAYGGLAVGLGNDLLIMFLSLTTFIAATGREVVKGISDVEGDKIRKIVSLARSRGIRIAAWVGALLFLAAVASSLLPIITSTVGEIYAILILVPDGIFIYAAIALLRRNTAPMALRIKKTALIGMLAGLLAFILGGVAR